MVEITKEEEVARNYRAALDSCDLLNAGKPELMKIGKIQSSVIVNIWKSRLLKVIIMLAMI